MGADKKGALSVPTVSLPVLPEGATYEQVIEWGALSGAMWAMAQTFNRGAPALTIQGAIEHYRERWPPKREGRRPRAVKPTKPDNGYRNSLGPEPFVIPDASDQPPVIRQHRTPTDSKNNDESETP